MPSEPIFARRRDIAIGVSFFMYVSTVMTVFERSRTEPVSPREWRTVASFMEKRARGTSVNGGTCLVCMKEDSLMNCIAPCRSEGIQNRAKRKSGFQNKAEWRCPIRISAESVGLYPRLDYAHRNKASSRNWFLQSKSRRHSLMRRLVPPTPRSTGQARTDGPRQRSGPVTPPPNNQPIACNFAQRLRSCHSIITGTSL